MSRSPIGSAPYPASARPPSRAKLCRVYRAAHLRVDTVEQALLRGGIAEHDLGVAGYAATFGVAADQLAVGLSVVADLVNPVAEVRDAWAGLAGEHGMPLVRVMVECSDREVHRSRVEQRVADIDGHRLPTWVDVMAREFEAWPEADVTIDTALTGVDQAVRQILPSAT